MNTVVPRKEEDMIYMFFEEMVDTFSFQNYRMSKPSRTFNTGKKHAESNCKSFWDMNVKRSWSSRLRKRFRSYEFLTN